MNISSTFDAFPKDVLTNINASNTLLFGGFAYKSIKYSSICSLSVKTALSFRHNENLMGWGLFEQTLFTVVTFAILHFSIVFLETEVIKLIERNKYLLFKEIVDIKFEKIAPIYEILGILSLLFYNTREQNQRSITYFEMLPIISVIISGIILFTRFLDEAQAFAKTRSPSIKSSRCLILNWKPVFRISVIAFIYFYIFRYL